MNSLVVQESVVTRTPHNSRWVIVTFDRPFLWLRHAAEHESDSDETWLMVPPRRYILNASQLEGVASYVESVSDLQGSAYHKPLLAGGPKVNLSKARILVERLRDRGIGDMLFMTGPLSYLQHLSGHTCSNYAYTLANRGLALINNTCLHLSTPMYGPLHYDDLPLYRYHWLIDAVTEYDEEVEQLNVYDALFKHLGLDYSSVDPRFKRPSIILDATDAENLDSFYFFSNRHKNLDLRKTGYYVVAPLAHSSLRSMNYLTWLHVIKELSERRPVIVLGQLTHQMPTTDITVQQFSQEVNNLVASGPVINLLGATPLRVVMAIISKAVAVVCLDSAPLYIAQACRVPAVSLWGPHHPGVRIGYDKDYMDLAIWQHEACSYSPCFAYAGFPYHKCPSGKGQTVCEVLKSIDVQAVLAKMNLVESERRTAASYKTATPVPV